MKEKMKLTKSKQSLADAIHSSGKGWPDVANWAAQDKRTPLRGFDIIVLYKVKPKRPRAGSDFWGGDTVESDVAGYINHEKLLNNWHQTILSREEYFSAYPADPVVDADGWIEWEGGECPVRDDCIVSYKMRSGEAFKRGEPASEVRWHHNGIATDIIAYRLHKPESNMKNKHMHQVDDIDVVELKPAIEQLASDYRNAKDYADRKQKEADAAKSDAEAKLALLVEAGKAHGLVVSPITEKQQSELVIADWRDLRVGDEVEAMCDAGLLIGSIVEMEPKDYCGERPFRFQPIGYGPRWCTTREFKFIRRP